VKQKDADAFCIPAPVDHIDELAEKMGALMIIHKKMVDMIEEKP
jgi:hypothetical protein